MAFNSAKNISSVAIAVALATLAPSVAFSQSANPTTPSPANPQPARPANRPSSGQGGLNLTPQQRERIRDILNNREQQIEAVLTPEQRTRVDQAKRSGQNVTVQSLNLTENQIQRIGSINQTANEAIKGVLTPEQWRQLETLSNNQNR